MISENRIINKEVYKKNNFKRELISKEPPVKYAAQNTQYMEVNYLYPCRGLIFFILNNKLCIFFYLVKLLKLYSLAFIIKISYKWR